MSCASAAMVVLKLRPLRALPPGLPCLWLPPTSVLVLILVPMVKFPAVVGPWPAPGIIGIKILSGSNLPSTFKPVRLLRRTGGVWDLSWFFYVLWGFAGGECEAQLTMALRAAGLITVVLVSFLRTPVKGSNPMVSSMLRSCDRTRLKARAAKARRSPADSELSEGPACGLEARLVVRAWSL